MTPTIQAAHQTLLDFASDALLAACAVLILGLAISLVVALLPKGPRDVDDDDDDGGGGQALALPSERTRLDAVLRAAPHQPALRDVRRAHGGLVDAKRQAADELAVAAKRRVH